MLPVVFPDFLLRLYFPVVLLGIVTRSWVGSPLLVVGGIFVLLTVVPDEFVHGVVV